MFNLSIETDNAAFIDNPSELADILRSLADRLDSDIGISSLAIADVPVRDSNGNRVGTASITV